LVPQYAAFQGISKSFDSLNGDSWQGKEIWGIIRPLAVNCAPFLVCLINEKKGTAHTGSDEIVMEIVWPIHEFSDLVSQHHHSNLSLKE